eukprot:4743856-Pleurochrysis_carterae.AAC.1
MGTPAAYSSLQSSPRVEGDTRNERKRESPHLDEALFGLDLHLDVRLRAQPSAMRAARGASRSSSCIKG